MKTIKKIFQFGEDLVDVERALMINIVHGELTSEVGQDTDMHRGIEATSRVMVADLAGHRQWQ